MGREGEERGHSRKGTQHRQRGGMGQGVQSAEASGAMGHRAASRDPGSESLKAHCSRSAFLFSIHSCTWQTFVVLLMCARPREGEPGGKRACF